jgi:hypothetical protein
MSVFQRREQPPAFTDYRHYKPYLRLDFLHRCAYCLLHEGDGPGGFQWFSIDHFRPRKRFPLLETTYENLYYACPWCNRAKSDTWPTPDESKRGYEFVDPCLEDLYLKHSVTDKNTGRVEPRSKPGDFTIRNIKLNRPIFMHLRKRRFEAQCEIEECGRKIASLLETADFDVRDKVVVLQEKIRLLDRKFINPKIPYEAADLQE